MQNRLELFQCGVSRRTVEFLWEGQQADHFFNQKNHSMIEMIERQVLSKTERLFCDTYKAMMMHKL